jgi:hypothetical protein
MDALRILKKQQNSLSQAFSFERATCWRLKRARIPVIAQFFEDGKKSCSDLSNDKARHFTM